MHASTRTMVKINRRLYLGLINSHYSLGGNTIDVYLRQGYTEYSMISSLDTRLSRRAAGWPGLDYCNHSLWSIGFGATCRGARRIVVHST